MAEVRAARRAQGRRSGGLFSPRMAGLERRKTATRIARAQRRTGPWRSPSLLLLRRASREIGISGRAVDQACFGAVVADGTWGGTRRVRHRGARAVERYPLDFDDERARHPGHDARHGPPDPPFLADRAQPR